MYIFWIHFLLRFLLSKCCVYVRNKSAKYRTNPVIQIFISCWLVEWDKDNAKNDFCEQNNREQHAGFHNAG